jgi:hypothetical protein
MASGAWRKSSCNPSKVRARSFGDVSMTNGNLQLGTVFKISPVTTQLICCRFSIDERALKTNLTVSANVCNANQNT